MKLSIVHCGLMILSVSVGTTVACAAEIRPESIGVEECPSVNIEQQEDSKTAEDMEVSLVGEECAAEAKGGSFFDEYLKGHLQIGIRTAHRVLTDDDSGHRGGIYGSGTFLGTIYALDLRQNYLLPQPYLRYFGNEYWGIELAYEGYEAETVASHNNLDYTDGDIGVSGFSVSIMGVYPNDSMLTPYAVFGIGLFSPNFSETSQWASSQNGYRRREIIADDVQAVIASLGVIWKITEDWNIDIAAKYIGNSDVDVTFKGYTGGMQDTEQYGHFPMDVWSLQLGVSYDF